jgi:ubiquinone biosynthesis protein Coq4
VKTKHQNIPIESLVQKDDHVIISIKEKLVKLIGKNNMKFKERREDTIAHVIQFESLTQKKTCLQKEITHQGVA